MRPINEWSIPSNAGYKEVRFEAQLLVEEAEEIEFSVEITGQDWYRLGLVLTPPSWHGPVDDFRVLIPSLMVPRRECQGLLEDLESWLSTRTDIERIFRSKSGQVFSIEIGLRQDKICDIDKPVCTFLYDGGFRLEVVFVVDQSCLRIARNGLAVVLQHFGQRSRGMNGGEPGIEAAP